LPSREPDASAVRARRRLLLNRGIAAIVTGVGLSVLNHVLIVQKVLSFVNERPWFSFLVYLPLAFGLLAGVQFFYARRRLATAAAAGQPIQLPRADDLVHDLTGVSNFTPTVVLGTFLGALAGVQTYLSYGAWPLATQGIVGFVLLGAFLGA